MLSAEKPRAPRLLSGGWWHRRPPLSKHQNSRLPEECRCSAYTTSFAQLGHSGPPLSFQVAGAFRSPSSPTPAKGQPRKETGRVNSHPNIKCVPSFTTCHTFLGPPVRGGLGPSLISLTGQPARGGRTCLPPVGCSISRISPAYWTGAQPGAGRALSVRPALSEFATFTDSASGHGFFFSLCPQNPSAPSGGKGSAFPGQAFLV